MDVVVVNWNAGPQLRRCLASLAAAEPGLCSVTLVDNHSQDDSLHAVTADRLLRNEENLGFAVACNQGAATGSNPYLLFLNPDTALEPGSLSRALEVLEREAGVGVVGVQLHDQAGAVQRTCARQPNTLSLSCHALGLTRLWPRMGYLMADWAHDADRDVEHVIGAFYLIRRELFERLGGFDERFFLYLEDLDLSRRVHETGYRIRYLSAARCMHVGGGTSRSIPDRRLYLSLRARLQFARLHLGAGFLVVAFVTLLLEPVVRSLHAALPGSTRVSSVARAYGMLYRWMIAR